MDIKVFLDSANHPRFTHMLTEFAKGVGEQIGSGDSVSLEYGMYSECDVAVIFGSWKNNPAPHHVVKNTVVNYAKNFIVLETPVIGRGPVEDIMKDDWYRMGLNGFLADTGNFNNKNRPGDRWDKIQKELDVEMLPWVEDKDRGDYVLVALQLPGDASLKGINISKWAYDTCHKIRKHTDRPIVIRTPQLPRQFDENTLYKLTVEIDDIQFQQGSKSNLNRAIDDAWCTVTYSSGLGVDSVMRGIPTFAMDSANFAYDLGNTDLSNIESPNLINRDQWVKDLSYAQWSIKEISRGTPWLHMKELLG